MIAHDTQQGSRILNNSFPIQVTLLPDTTGLPLDLWELSVRWREAFRKRNGELGIVAGAQIPHRDFEELRDLLKPI